MQNAIEFYGSSVILLERSENNPIWHLFIEDAKLKSPLLLGAHILKNTLQNAKIFEIPLGSEI